MLIINDLHIGVSREGGTTPHSQQALRDYLRKGLETLLALDEDWVIVNGDLFDKFTVDTHEIVETAKIFADWLKRTNGNLTLIAGNHDWSPRAGQVSSFHLLGHMLQMLPNGRVSIKDAGLSYTGPNISSIPHMANQSLFDDEIEKAVINHPPSPSYLLLHCNYKNDFTESSDHSLNLNDAQVVALMRAGWTLIIGHEHQGRVLREGRVVVVGNQFPSSAADCLGNTEKHAVRVTESGIEFVPTWSASGSFLEVDWRNLEGASGEFIRVTGNATAQESAEVIRVISKLRQSSDAFVISSNIKILGSDSLETAAIALEDLKNFDILAEICEHFSVKEQDVIRGLVNV